MPFEARVKSVLSGDTVVLSHVTNPSQERILSLAYVSAPRLRREGDEVCTLLCLNAYQSRSQNPIDCGVQQQLASQLSVLLAAFIGD